MRVKSVEFKNFAKHLEGSVELPETGIVLVTGRNGAGKSSIIEAVSMALWGKTLRGTTPWRKDTAGFVRVLAGGVDVTRKCSKGGKTSLSFDPSTSKKFNTKTKAKDALESQIMPWDLWKRTHVFSSHDAAHFTLASDGERKRLIESFLGLSCFDGGLALCRADLKDLRQDLTRDEQNLEQAKIRYHGAKQQLASAQETLRLAQDVLAQGIEDEEHEAPPTDEQMTDLRRAVEKLNGALDSEETDLHNVVARLRELESAVVQAETKLSIKQSEVGELIKGKCPTCGEELPKEKRSALEESLLALVVQVKNVKKISESERRTLEKQKTQHNKQLSALRQQINVASSNVRVAQDRVRAAERRKNDRRIEQAEQAVLDATTKVETIEKTLSKMKVTIKQQIKDVRAKSDEVTFLETVEAILGLRGVRTHVLGQALTGIEAMASYWLAKITEDPPDASLELKPYSEKKSGGVSDALSLVVHGFGGGYGYKAASGGERRRVDVALTMAMATIASAAQGLELGTVFFDEVFDSLDPGGVAAVAEALAEMALERPIVVISHSAHVQNYLPVSVHLEVDKGVITTK